jgi:hypothetical protein
MTRRLVMALGLLAAVVVHAEDTGQWSNVQALRKGDRIGVIQSNQKSVEGRFENATDVRITLQADREISLEKSEVVRVYRRPRHGRVFGAVVGGVIGVAAGGIMDGTVGQRFRNEGDSPAKGVLTAAGAGIGAGIGAASTGWYHTVYQRK